jgi:large subunit ribosomal protein L28
MAKCDVCGKAMLTGHRISITRSQVSRRANHRWHANVKRIKIIEASGNVKRIHICTRCLRSDKVKRAI